MREFSRQSRGAKLKVNVNNPIRDVFKLIGYKLKSEQIEVSLTLQPDLPFIMAEHNRLEQVFLNLVQNAIDSIKEKKNAAAKEYYKKKLSISTFSVRGKVIIEVSDTGTGIPEKNIRKIFEPFFTTKAPGKGTGMGIGISDRIIRDYDGEMTVDSREGEGTTFILTFPAAS